MERRRLVVAYDIRDDRRLRRVHLVCREYGYPLQYSVFVCDLSARERLGLRSDLEDEMNLAADSVVFIDVGDVAGRGRESFTFVGHRQFRPPDTTRATIL